MSNRESVTLVVEHPKAESDLDSNSEVSREVHISSKKWQAVARFLGFYWILTRWKEIFVTSCVFAVSLDPLFLYIPIINYDRKCLQFDGKLKTATLILRSITDLFYIMDIVVQVHRYKDYSSLFPTIAKTIGRSYIIIDILAILPFPQVVILTLSSKTRASRSLITRKLLMNFFLLIQYVPRVLRIYLLCKEPRKSHKATETAIWVKGVLNFFMYILASHVIGAVWYFFAIQRMLGCWQYACRNESGCDTFGCHEPRAVRNIEFLNDNCPIDLPDAKLFDFGIYLSILQSSIPRSQNFQQKVSNCFCWGLRNLSSLGSNLQPSTNTMENLFVAFVSIIGLLLFIYLIGNLQTYLQLDTARIEAHRHKMKVEGRLEKIDTEIELWLSKNGIPKRSMKDIKPNIMSKVRQELEENRDVNVDQDLMSILPLKLQSHIKSCMPFTKLKQVLVLQKMDERILKAICRHLIPVMYTDNNIIVGENAPLQVMLFIVDGVAVIERTNDSSKLELRAGDIYGEKLLVWPSLTSFPDELPQVADSIRAMGDVEALVLRSEDMRSLGSKLRKYFRKYSKYCALKEHLSKIRIGGFEFETALKIFTTQELEAATNNFDHSRIIGKGGYGAVFKGILPDRTEVAIKRLGHFGIESRQFVQEVITLSKVSHRHVVRLLGCCIETETPLMIFEYMPNGSLYEHIHGTNDGNPTLSFKVRMKIAAESAGALAYMHSLPLSIIHGDVKSVNILLDDNYSSKVTDFGCSHVIDHDSMSHTSVVHGTFGYLDPEYVGRGRITERSDVYSFGVVLAELLTSRKAISLGKPDREVLLARLLIHTVKEGHLDQIIDHEVVDGENIRAARKVAYLACSCLKRKGVDRPSMKQVATELELLLKFMENHPEEEQESQACFSRASTFAIELDDYILPLDEADVNTIVNSDDDEESDYDSSPLSTR